MYSMLFVFKFLCTSVRVFEWVLGTPYRPTPPPKRFGYFSFRNLPGRHLQISKEAVSQKKKKAFCTSNFLVFWCSIYFFITSLFHFFIVLPVFKYLGIWSRRPCVCQATEEGLMKSMMSWCTAVFVFLISFDLI